MFQMLVETCLCNDMLGFSPVQSHTCVPDPSPHFSFKLIRSYFCAPVQMQAEALSHACCKPHNVPTSA